MALKIVVVGAGLGGLSAGISCVLSGHTVTVVESANELSEVSCWIAGTFLVRESNSVNSLDRCWATDYS